MCKSGINMFTQFEANPADHQAVITKKPPLGPPGWKREVRSSPPPLSFTLSANHSLPTTPMRSKTVADLGSSESFFKEDEAFSAEAASKTLKRLSDVEWEKDSVMWNWVRVTIWPSFAAPTPTIRCQFSSSIIPPPLLRLLLLPQLPVTVHRNPISHQPRHPRLWLVILLYDFNDPLSTHFPLLYVHPTFTFYTDQYQYYHLLYYFPTPPTSAATTSPFYYSLLLHLLVPLLCPGHSSDVSSVHQLLFKTTTKISISNRMKWIHEWFLSESRPIDPSIQWSSPSWPTAVPVRATNHRRQNITEDRKRKKIREYIYLLWYILTDDPKHDTYRWS